MISHSHRNLEMGPGRTIRLAAIDPRDPGHLIAATETGLIERTAQGKWRPHGDRVGFLAWPKSGPIYLVEADGKVEASDDAGVTWQPRGDLPEPPVALTAVSATELYAALQSGTIMGSDDGGARWTVRVSP